jgi:uncharacterized protein (UPF0371 family)
MRRVGFDRPEKYVALQSHHIAARRQQFGGKLYLELGGKLFDDLHASRVLRASRGHQDRDARTAQGRLEIVVVVSAKDLARNKMRADHGISYDEDVSASSTASAPRPLRGQRLYPRVTEDNGHARAFKRKLEKLGLKVYRHYPIKATRTTSPSS